MSEKGNKGIILLKTAMIILTLVYSFTMVFLSGAGIIYNSESYGKELTFIGISLVISSIFMTSGAFLCIPKKKIHNILSAVFSVSGVILCMTMLYRLCEHADRAGWSSKYTMNPISDMYKTRIVPCLIPAAISVIIAVIQIIRSKKISPVQ